MRILLGAPVWYGNRPFKRTIEALYRLGLDYFEFSLDYPLPECMNEKEREAMRDLLEEFGLKIAFHSPLDISVAHPRKALADASMTILRQCMAFSAEFHPLSLYYNVHVHPKVSTYTLEDVRVELKRKGLSRCAEIAQMGSEFGIPVSVENDLIPFERSELIHEALSSTTLSFTLDIGHAILAEVMHSSMKSGSYVEYLERWVARCGAKLLVVHLHDCSLTAKRDHLSLGRGELDFSQIFALLKRTSCNYAVIETFWRNPEKEEMNYDEMRRNVEFCRRAVV